MGRYYNGDIEGKFWFAVQSSDDADFFGVTGNTPNYLNYYFDKSNLKSIEKGIKECKKELYGYKGKINNFFNLNQSYTDEMLANALNVKEGEAKTFLMWYARLVLGEKILACVKKNGSCDFDAEL